MAVNVAELVATISLQVQGANEAVRGVEQLTRAQAALESASQSTSASVADLANKLADAVGEVEAFEAAVAAVPSQIAQFEQQAASAGAEVERLTKQMERLKAEQQAAFDSRDLARYRAIGQELRQVRSAIGSASNEQIGAAQAAESLRSLTPEVVTRRRIELLADVERRTKAVEGATRRNTTTQARAAQMFRLTNSEAGAFALQLARGQASLGAFTALIGRSLLALPQMAAGLAAVAVVLAPMIIGFKTLTGELSRMAQVADRRNIAAPMSRDLRQLRDDLNLTTAAVQSFYERSRNVAQSRGIADAQGFAESSFAAAGNLRFLSSDQDASRAIEAINSAVSGSTGALAEYGLNVAEINRQLQNLPPDATQAERAIVALNAVNAQLAERQTEIGRANARTKTSFEDLATAGTKIKEMFAQAIVPAVNQFVQMLESMMQRGAPAIAAVGVAIKFMAGGALNVLKVLIGAVEGFITIWQVAGTRIVNAVKAMFPPLKILIDILDFFVPDGAFSGIVDEFERMQDQIRDFASEMGGAVPDLRNFQSEVESVGDSFQEMRSKITGGFSVVDSVRQFGDALNAIDSEGLNGRNAFALARAIDQQMNTALDGGLERLSLLGQELSRLRSEGFISTEEFEAVNRILRDSQESLRPFDEAAQNVNRQVSGVTEVASTAQSSVQAVGSALDALNGKRVTTYIDVITTGSGIFAGFTTSGATGPYVGGTPGGGTQGRRGSRSSSGLAGPRPPDGSSVAAENRRFAQIAKAADDTRNAAQDVANALSGGGGGGGGGGGASIGDIRAFFREMNRLIKIGVNDGVAFSTAGNTIPLGGTGEFLNRKGGTLIETVNIRGIWDFTDPGQKKQIIRELEEALANLKRGQN